MSCARPGCSCREAPLHLDEQTFCGMECREQARTGQTQKATGKCDCGHYDCAGTH